MVINCAEGLRARGSGRGERVRTRFSLHTIANFIDKKRFTFATGSAFNCPEKFVKFYVRFCIFLE